MSTLRRHLNTLRRLPSSERCDACRDWPDTRVVHTDPTMADLTAGWAAQWGPPPRPEPPERCSGCGWEPLTIVVEYVDGPALPRDGGEAA